MKNTKLFITGMSGTAGRALTRLAIEKNYLVAGTTFQHFPPDLNKLAQKNLIKHYHIDLRNTKDVEKAINDFQPNVVIHLAGKVLGRSDKQVSSPAIYTENLTIFRNVLSAIKNTETQPRLILSSGCLVYDKATSPEVISEVSPENIPTIDLTKEPYRASKLDQEKLLTKSNIDYIITRPTQFTGPGKIPGVVEYYIAEEILQILSGKKNVISVRNKLGEVDMLDARDVAQAYLTLIEKGHSRQVYHICSGQPATVEQVAKVLWDIAGLDPKKFQINSTDAEQTIYFRFSSYNLKKLGWKPTYNLKDALTTYWEYFKNQKIS